jgi:hypothetical protein
MNTGETPNLPFGRNQEETRQANDFCEGIRHAAELTESAQQLLLIAQRASDRVTQGALFGNLPYRLEVIIPKDNEAYVISDDDEIVEIQPEQFVATGVRSIGKFGVEFYNGYNRQELKLKTFDFGVSPIFIDYPSDPIQDPEDPRPRQD